MKDGKAKPATHWISILENQIQGGDNKRGWSKILKIDIRVGLNKRGRQISSVKVHYHDQLFEEN